MPPALPAEDGVSWLRSVAKIDTTRLL